MYVRMETVCHVLEVLTSNNYLALSTALNVTSVSLSEWRRKNEGISTCGEMDNIEGRREMRYICIECHLINE